MTQVGRMMRGDTDALKEYGITISKTVKGSLNILNVLKSETANLENVVQAQKKTIGWQLDNIKNTTKEKWAQIVESLDKLLFPILSRLNDLIASIDVTPIKNFADYVSSYFTAIKENIHALEAPAKALNTSLRELWASFEGLFPTGEKLELRVQEQIGIVHEALKAVEVLVYDLAQIAIILKEFEDSETGSKLFKKQVNDIKHALQLVQVIGETLGFIIKFVGAWIKAISDTTPSLIRAITTLNFSGVAEALDKAGNIFTDKMADAMLETADRFKKIFGKAEDTVNKQLGDVKFEVKTPKAPKEVEIKAEPSVKKAQEKLQTGVDKVFDSVDMSKAEEAAKVAKAIDWSWIKDLQNASKEISFFQAGLKAFAGTLKDVSMSSFAAINSEMDRLKQLDFAKEISSAFRVASAEVMDFANAFEERVIILNSTLKEAFTSSIKALSQQAVELKEKADFKGIFSGMLDELLALGDTFKKAYTEKLKAISFNIDTDKIPSEISVETTLNLKSLQEKIQTAVNALFAGIKVPVDKAEEVDAAFKKIDWSWTAKLQVFVKLFTTLGETLSSFSTSVKSSVDAMSSSLLSGAEKLKEIDFAGILSSILTKATEQLSIVGTKFADLFVAKLQNVQISLSQVPKSFELQVSVDASKAAAELQQGVNAIFESVEVPAEKASEVSKIAASIDWSWIPLFKEAAIGMSIFKESAAALTAVVKDGFSSAISKIAEDLKAFKVFDFSATVEKMFKATETSLETLAANFKEKLQSISVFLDTSALPKILSFSVGVDFSAVTEALQRGVDALFKAIDLSKAREATEEASKLDWSFTSKLTDAVNVLFNFNDSIILFKDKLINALNGISFVFKESAIPKVVELSAKISIDNLQKALQSAIDSLFSALSFRSAVQATEEASKLDWSWTSKLIDAVNILFNFNSSIGTFKDALVEELKGLTFVFNEAAVPKVVELSAKISVENVQKALQSAIDSIFSSLKLEKYSRLLTIFNSFDWSWIDELNLASSAIKTFKASVNGLESIFTPILNNIIDNFTSAINHLENLHISQKLILSFEKATAEAEDAVESFKDSIIKALNGMKVEVAAYELPSIVEIPVKIDFTSFFSRLQNGIDAVFSAISLRKVEEFTSIAKNLDWSWIPTLDSATSAFEDLKASALGFATSLRSSLVSSFENTASTASSFATSLKNVLTSAFEDLTTSIRALSGAASDFANLRLDEIFKEVLQSTEDSIKEEMLKFKASFSQAIEKISFSFDSSKVPKAISLSVGIDTRELQQKLQNAVNELFNFIKVPAEKTREFAKAVAALDWSWLDGLQEAVTGFKVVKSLLSEVGSGLKTSLSSAIDSVIDAVSRLQQANIDERISNVFKGIANVFGEQIQEISEKIQEKFTQALESISFKVNAPDAITISANINTSELFNSVQNAVNLLFNSITLPTAKIAEANTLLQSLDWSFTSYVEIAADAFRNFTASIASLASTLQETFAAALSRIQVQLQEVSSIDFTSGLKKAFFDLRDEVERSFENSALPTAMDELLSNAKTSFNEIAKIDFTKPIKDAFKKLTKELETKINTLEAFKVFSKSVSQFGASAQLFNNAVDNFVREQQMRKTEVVTELKTANTWLQKINSNLTGVDAFA